MMQVELRNDDNESVLPFGLQTPSTPNTKPRVVTTQCLGIGVYCNDREFCDRTHIVITLSFAWCQLVWDPKLIH